MTKTDIEKLLKLVQRDEKKDSKGKLKIFLGMAAGVGKTYAMLREAQKKAEQGVDIAIGIVNTHNRPETAKLAEGLKIIPEKEVEYKSIKLKEFDLDAVLERKPTIVLIDELAHTNAPGCRHPKRWQDVIEILDAGIDVYTTLNIQHLESYKDIVEGITGITIHETVPDYIIEIAAIIELIDLTPAELIQRLREGKVYVGELSRVAIENFFQEDRLTALREIALRLTADKVDHELHMMLSSLNRPEGWKARERLLAVIDHSPSSEKLIRTTRRLAFHLDATWLALYVNTGETLTEAESKTLDNHLTLARSLGGEILSLSDPDKILGIQRTAEQHDITQLIVCKDEENHGFIKQLIKNITNINILLVSPPSVFLPKKQIQKERTKPNRLHYLLAPVSAVLLTGLNLLIGSWFGFVLIPFVFLLGIMGIGLFLDFIPLLIATLLSTVGFLILETSYTPTQQWAFALTFFLVGGMTAYISHRVKHQRELLVKRGEYSTAFYSILKDIAGAPSTGHVLKAVKEKMEGLLNGQVFIVIKHSEAGHLFKDNLSFLAEKEQGVAMWVYKNGREGGWSTSTLPSAENLYIPLKGRDEVYGIIIYHPLEKNPLSPEETTFLYTVADELSHFFERTLSEERRTTNKQIEQIENIYQTILRLIKEEFEHPVNDIYKTIKNLKEYPLTNVAINNLEKSTDSLKRIFGNISAMATLSEGLFTLFIEPNSVHKLIDAAIETLQDILSHHQIKINVDPIIQPIPFDFTLIHLLLTNLLTNAANYSPADTLIEIQAEVQNSYFVLSVLDEGPGIKDDMLEVIFERFTRSPDASISGLGLGLPIARSIAQIHGGFLKVQNRSPKGAKFSLILPITS